MWARWVLVGVVLLCAGCEARLRVDAVFDRDGGGRLVVALTADEDLRARAEAAGTDPLGDLVATGEHLTPGWTVTDTTADGARTIALSAEFDDPDAFEGLSTELAHTLNAPEADLLAPLTVRVEEERLVVAGSARLQPTPAVREWGLVPDQVVALLREEDAFSYVVRVALPGEVLDSTATEQEADGTLRWTVEPGQEVVVHAVARRPGTPVWPLVVGAVVGLMVGVVVLRRATVVRRRSR